MKKISILFVLLIFLYSGIVSDHNVLAKESKTEIVIIDVTDQDIHKYGRFPWTRDIHGKALNILSQHKAKGVLFDMVFSETDARWPEKDLEFAQAIASADIPVFIPFFFVKPGGGAQTFSHPIQTISVKDNTDINKLEYDVLPSLQKFTAATAGTGFINIFPDRKGVLEEITTTLYWNGRYYPFIGITIAAHYLNIPFNEIFLEKNTLNLGSKQLKLTARAGFKPDFGKPYKKYKHYSYTDLFEGRTGHISGKFAIMGFNATGLSDFVVTRTSNRYPGTEIHAVFIDYFLNEL